MRACKGEKERSARQLASEILLKVDARKAYADILLDHTLKTTRLSDRDRALLTELTYGTLRWRGNIDARLTQQIRRPLSDTDPFIRNLLRITFYQLFFLDKIPTYAAVNEAVELAKAHSGDKVAGFVNGVLRSFLRQKDKSAKPQTTDSALAAMAVEYSHPEWLVRRWLDYFGQEEAPALMRANNQRAPLVLRVNRRKGSREELLVQLVKAGISAVATQLAPQGVWVQSGPAVDQLPGYEEGLFQVQAEASQLVTYLLSPLSGERILDACAAPGGKTTHIAELAQEAGEIIAMDTSARGLEKIRANAARLGLNSVRVVCADASQELSSSYSRPYDRILIDAPCSGLGTLRSHPEIKWHRGEKDIARLCRLQSKIVNQAAAYLKTGGVLVYSTCTLSRDENEKVVEEFLASRREFVLENAAGYLPQQARHAVRGSYLMTLPHQHNTDGFFAARMRKIS